MSIEAAIGQMDEIMAVQRALASRSPSIASSTQTSPTAAATGETTGARTSGASFGNALAAAQASTGAAGAATGAASAPGVTSAAASGYANPLTHASVSSERIDQGVDYAGSGTLGAIGPGVVTNVVQTGSGWEGGGYVEYKLTAGPYAGRSIFYAEGVAPTVQVGQTLAPGQPVATIIPGSAHGIEIGFAAGKGEAAYASAYGGGYSEGHFRKAAALGAGSPSARSTSKEAPAQPAARDRAT